MSIKAPIDGQHVKGRQLTNAERVRRFRAKHGGTVINFTAHIEAAASVLYLRKQWGFKSNQQAVEAALRYLTIQTRRGLTKLNLDITQDD